MGETPPSDSATAFGATAGTDFTFGAVTTGAWPAGSEVSGAAADPQATTIDKRTNKTGVKRHQGFNLRLNDCISLLPILCSESIHLLHIGAWMFGLLADYLLAARIPRILPEDKPLPACNNSQAHARMSGRIISI